MQKEEKIKDLNRRVQLKAQQRAKQQQQQHHHDDTNTTVSSPNNTDQRTLTDDVIIVNNSTQPTKLISQSEEPNVGTLVTIATTAPPDYNSLFKASKSKATTEDTVGRPSVVVARGDVGVVARDGVVVMDTSPPSLGNSDSALPATSSTTAKNSACSASGAEENYSESYC